MEFLPTFNKYKYSSPNLSTSQQEATSGKRYNREDALGGYLTSQIPAMRESKRYQGLLAQRQSEQEAISQQHLEEMALEERALRQREKAREQEEKYAKIGLGIQGIGLGLKAWDTWTNREKNKYNSFMPEQYGSGGSNSLSSPGWNISGGTSGSGGGGGGSGISISYSGTW